MFYDRGNLVQRAVGTVSSALLEAIVLVVVLLLLFLGNVRAAVVVAVTLPLAALATFILMGQFGMSANLMSLGGLAIAIGMLVDAAVVVVENIVTHLAHDRTASCRACTSSTARCARSRVPVASGIAIIVIVFLPLLTLQGLEGKLFKPVALSIVFALSGSLRALAHGDPGARLVSSSASPRTRIPGWCASYSRSTRPRSNGRSRTREIVFGVAGASAGAGRGRLPAHRQDLHADDGRGRRDHAAGEAAVHRPGSAALATDLADPAGDHGQGARGDAASWRAPAPTSSGWIPMGLNQTDTFMVLKPRDRVAQAGQGVAGRRDAQGDGASSPGSPTAFTQPIEMRVSEMLTGVRGDLAVKIFGPDLPP